MEGKLSKLRIWTRLAFLMFRACIRISRSRQVISRYMMSSQWLLWSLWEASRILRERIFLSGIRMFLLSLWTVRPRISSSARSIRVIYLLISLLWCLTTLYLRSPLIMKSFPRLLSPERITIFTFPKIWILLEVASKSLLQDKTSPIRQLLLWL